MSIDLFCYKSEVILAFDKLHQWLETGDCDDCELALTANDLIGPPESENILNLLYSRSKTVLLPIPKGKFRYQARNELNLAGQVEGVGKFFIGETPVTHGEWVCVIKWATRNGYGFEYYGGSESVKFPANCDWWNALKWCNAKSEKDGLKPCYSFNGKVYRTGKDDSFEQTQQRYIGWDREADGYRLPTQIEWERAARGGLEGKKYPTGDSLDENERSWALLKRWQVRGGAVNNYGLYNMIGNVPEWCWDAYGNSSSNEGCRIMRGGVNRRECVSYESENSARRDCRVYNIDFMLPNNLDYDVGIRVVRGRFS